MEKIQKTMVLLNRLKWLGLVLGAVMCVLTQPRFGDIWSVVLGTVAGVGFMFICENEKKNTICDHVADDLHGALEKEGYSDVAFEIKFMKPGMIIRIFTIGTSDHDTVLCNGAIVRQISKSWYREKVWITQLIGVKSEEEIEELERAAAIGYKMHTAAMRLCRPGVTEQYIGGVLDGIASAYGCLPSFQSIVSMHGEILHGYPSPRPLEAGRLLLCDAGAETINNYCSDHTRTTPISGRYTQRQKDIYNIVVDAHDLALTAARPGVRWWDVHMAVCRLITERLKDLGLMRGDTDEAVRAGAHALFLPHGLGHAMGMDVHDMEGLGQIHVGYDAETRPSSQFGLASLRFARRLEVGHVVTDEPGIYFIPDLIDLWRREGTNAEFLCFDEIEKFKDFGGVRIEDDVLITPTGCRFLGKERIPYHVPEVEEYLAAHADQSPIIF